MNGLPTALCEVMDVIKRQRCDRATRRITNRKSPNHDLIKRRKSVSVGASLKYFDGKVRPSKLALGLFGNIGALENIYKCKFIFVEQKDANIS